MKRYFAVLACAIPLAAFAQTAPVAQPNPACPGTILQPYVPVYGTVEGKPIDDRLPEKCRDTRQFPEQTRASYHHAADFKVTVLTDKLRPPGAAAILPDGNILVTEKLPGGLRVVMKNGKIVDEEALLVDLKVRIRDVQVDADGALYVLTDSGSGDIHSDTPTTSKLLKLTPP